HVGNGREPGGDTRRPDRPVPRASAERAVTRRLFLGGGAATLGLIITGCSSSDDSSTAAITTSTLTATSPPDDGTDTNGNGDANGAGDGELDDASTVFGPEDFEDFGVCRSMPEQMAGPYPSPELLLRRDITEDRDGVPLRVGAQLVDADCDPIPNAVLE